MTQYSGKVIRKTPVTPTQQAASGVWKLNEQAAAIRNNNWPVPGVPNPISRSVRLRSSASANLTRTPSISGNRKTWTWSAWLKRGSLSQTGTIWGSNFSAGGFGLAFGNYGGTGVNPQLIGVTLYAVGTVTTNAVFRDPSAWYHIVARFDSTQATQADRFRLYINGVQQTLSSALNVTLNADYNVNLAGAPHVIGGEATYFNDCYLTEINHVDGQSLAPSSFGTTDPLTGVWEPIPYTGTYGTNGFYLNFKDNTSTTTLGLDYSGNSNNWTANNISLTSGVTYDSMLDVPTQWIGYSTTTDTSAVTRGNYCVMNPLDQNLVTATQGNLYVTCGASTAATIPATFGMTSGKWYVEFTPDGAQAANNMIGICNLAAAASNRGFSSPNGWYYWGSTGQKYTNNTASSYGSSYTSGDVIAIEFDADVGTLTFYKNNVSQGTAFTGLTGATYAFAINSATASAGVAAYVNFGQRPFTYNPGSGFKSLNTTNLPNSTIVQGNQWMDATTYTGNNSTNVITNSGSMQPDFLWIKSRSSAFDNELYDSVRGVTKYLASNTTAAEATETAGAGVTSFNSNGFTLGPAGGAYVNNNTLTFVAWQWKANGTPAVTNTAGSITSTVSASTTSGFSVVTYTGNNVAGATIGHGLGVAPSIIIVKKRSATGDWPFYHKSLGATGELVLNSTTAFITIAGVWNNTAPTSSVFSVGGGGASGSGDVNTSGATFVAYCFAPVAGFSAFGSYTGNGSSDGPFVYTGFRPRFVMIKWAGGVENWAMIDTARAPSNTVTNQLFANSAGAENVDANQAVDILSNGFKLRGSLALFNQSSQTYIFMAFAENPFKNALAR